MEIVKTPPVCPRCGTQTKRHNIVKVTGNDRIKTVGYHYFCPNMNCKYEEVER